MMKYNLLVISIAAIMLSKATLAVEASDDGTGYYTSLHAGYANRHLIENSFFQSRNNQTVTAKTDPGITGGINLGYIFSRNFALETGWIYLPIVKANLNSADQSATVKLTGYAAHFLLCSSVEFQHGVSAYLKLGMAYANTLMSYTGQSSSKVQSFRPTFGIGLAYALNSIVTLSGEWRRIMGNSNAFDAYAQQQQVFQGGTFTKMPNLDLFMLGISYRF